MEKKKKKNTLVDAHRGKHPDIHEAGGAASRTSL